MTRFGMMVAGAGFAALLPATALADTGSFADPRSPTLGGSVQTQEIVPTLLAPQQGEAPRTLFLIGDAPVHVWTPVAPPYETAANRNGAANPLWGPE